MPEALDIPPRSELEGMTDDEVVDKYGVDLQTARRWMAHRGLYDHQREFAGCTSELGRKLLAADPDDVGGAP